ncbi:outer membrane protein [Pseudomonadota bacterium]
MNKTQNRKTVLLGLGLMALVASMAVSPVLADEYDGNVRLAFGQKRLDSDDWNTLDRQNEIGVIFDLKKASWPVSIALDLLFSGEDKNVPGAERGSTFEQHLGVRKIWAINDSKFHPYLGGGIAFIQADYEVIGSSKEDDGGVGGWIGAGVDWHLSKRMSLGVDVRYSKADVTINNNDVDAGGLHSVLTLGYRW